MSQWLKICNVRKNIIFQLHLTHAAVAWCRCDSYVTCITPVRTHTWTRHNQVSDAVNKSHG